MDDRGLKGNILFIVLVIFGGLAAIVFWSQTSEDYKPEPTKPIFELSVGSIGPLGDEGAPVVIVEFGDFYCDFCLGFIRNVEEKIRENFVSNSLVKIYWRDFPFLNESSSVVAIGARCADEQDSFWQYRDLLFENQDILENPGEIIKNLVALADQINLNEDIFTDCLASQKHTKQVESDKEEAKSLGIQGVPTVFIGVLGDAGGIFRGEKISGAQPYEVYSEAIKRHLAR